MAHIILPNISQHVNDICQSIEKEPSQWVESL